MQESPAHDVPPAWWEQLLELLATIFRQQVATTQEHALSGIATAGEGLFERLSGGLGAFFAAFVEDPRKARIQEIETVGVSEAMLDGRLEENANEESRLLDNIAGAMDEETEAFAGVFDSESLFDNSAQGLECLIEDGGDEIVLGGEVPVEGADADTGAIGHFLHVDFGAALGEKGARSLDDAGAVEAGIGAGRLHRESLSIVLGIDQ